MKALQKSLQERIGGVVSSGGQVSGERTTNFGHLFSAKPLLLVEPKSADDVAAAIRFAREHHITLSARGSGHSQSFLAISDGGILLDMPALGRIGKVEREALTVDVEGGTVAISPRSVWRLPSSPTI